MLDTDWTKVESFFKTRFKKTPDLKSILFLIGLRELGKVEIEISKEDKMDLMNLAFCRIASESGYFKAEEIDADGWPIWNQAKPMPSMTVKEQEVFIKEHLVKYCDKEGLV